MTPKEKAEELVDKYKFIYIQNYTSMHEVKECALIAVDELIKSVPHFDNMHFFDEGAGEYWVEVKQEIEKL